MGKYTDLADKVKNASTTEERLAALTELNNELEKGRDVRIVSEQVTR